MWGVAWAFFFVVAVSACGRHGFERPSTRPLEHFTAAPNIGGREGEIRIELEVPADLEVARIEIRRAPGEIAPVDCRDGALALTLDPAATSAIDGVRERWYRTFSYRGCALDSSGRVVAEGIVERVAYFNPGPGCQHPPCTPVSSAPTSGSFLRGPSVLSDSGSTGGDVLLSDLDGDDHLDILVVGPRSPVVHFGRGDGTFEPAVAIANGAWNTHAAVTGDFNNDAISDVVLANRAAPSKLLLGSGGRSFAPPRDISPAIYVETFDVEAADLDGDAFLDLVFIQYGAEDYIFRGDGAGGFSLLRTVQPAVGFSCVNCLQLHDINRDGLVDLIIGYNTGAHRLEVYLGKGDGSFEIPFAVPYGALTPIAVRVADLDRDGNLDLVVGRSLDGGIWIARGDGTGRFTDLVALATSTVSRCYGLAAHDFDGDGDIDILFSQDAAGTIGFLRGKGDGTFDPQIDLDGGSTWTTTNIDVGDLDHDGKLDFVMGVDIGNSQYFLGL